MLVLSVPACLVKNILWFPYQGKESRDLLFRVLRMKPVILSEIPELNFSKISLLPAKFKEYREQ